MYGVKKYLISAIDAYLSHSIFPPVSNEHSKRLNAISFFTYLNGEKIIFRPMQVDVLRLTVVQALKWKTKRPPYLFIDDQRAEYRLLLLNNQVIQASFVRDGKIFYWMKKVGKQPVPKCEIIGWDFLN